MGFRRPIRALVHGAGLLGEGQFDVRVPARRSDELGELARVFNQLAARLEDTERARRQWVADTSHELRTPLAVLRAQLEALADGVRPVTRENLALLLRQARALDMLVNDLYAMARADVGQLPYRRVPLDAWALVEDLWQDFTGRFGHQRLQATRMAPDGRASVLADGDRLRQVFSNLLENSARYTAPGGRIELAGTITGGTLQIQLDDSAPGVPAPLLDRLGERFFRVEPSRSRQHGGAGLGLALSRQLIEAQGGSLAFAPSPLGGLRVTVTLPLEL
jgi:two-component system sensor histidine kinase BaeS